MEIVNKHDYIHLLKAANQHIVEAIAIAHACANYPEQERILTGHLKNASDAIEVFANEAGIELTNGGE